MNLADQVYRLTDGWYCLVAGREFGPWLLRGYALAGMATEQRRCEARKMRAQEEAERLGDHFCTGE